MKIKSNRIKRFLIMPFTTLFFMKVLAEEPTATEPPAATPPVTSTEPPIPAPSGGVNFEELIAKARKEERDKLYPDLEKQKDKVNNLLLVVAERDKTIEETTAKIAKLEKEIAKLQANPSTASTEASAQIATLERAVETMKTSHESALKAKDLEIFKLKKLQEIGTQNLIPELVGGNSEEEIAASIETSKQRYQAIFQAAVNGVHVPPANPSSSTVTINTDKSAAEIASMTPQQYAEWRKSSGIK